MKYIYTFLSVILLCQCRQKAVEITFREEPVHPKSITEEHSELLADIRKFAAYPDSTGAAAKEVEKIISHHFSEEEAIILPLLGLLPQLVEGAIPEEKDKFIELARRAALNHPHLNVEHQFIKILMTGLSDAAQREGYTEVPHFEEKLSKHATLEEEVLFPAAILVGKYLEAQQK